MSHVEPERGNSRSEGNEPDEPFPRMIEPLYCDIHGTELQRESCNHVRPCEQCLAVERVTGSNWKCLYEQKCLELDEERERYRLLKQDAAKSFQKRIGAELELTKEREKFAAIEKRHISKNKQVAEQLDAEREKSRILGNMTDGFRAMRSLDACERCDVRKQLRQKLAAEREQSVNLLREKTLEFAEQSGNQIKCIKALVEALVQVDVDYQNKKAELPRATHGMLMNALAMAKVVNLTKDKKEVKKANE